MHLERVREAMPDPVDAPYCPKCRLPLRPITHAGIALDACVECKGLWFDGGEVERVIGAQTAHPF